MTKAETTKILAMLKAAYPDTFGRNLTIEDTKSMVNLWTVQFSKFPVDVVAIAVNKIISTKPAFAPTISEVKEKIRSLYYEAWGMLHQHKQGLQPLDDKTLKQLKEIIRVVEPMRTQQQIEPTLGELLGGYAQYLTNGNQKQIEQ